MSHLVKPMSRTSLCAKQKFVGANLYLRPATIAMSALLAVGCGSSGGGDDSGGTTGTTAGATDSGTTAGEMGENTTATGGISGENFPAFQGVFGVTEKRIDGVRTLSLEAGFIESDTRIFQGHQFLLGQDRCQEVFGGLSDLPPEPISAGEVLVVSNTEGTLAQLDERLGLGVAEDYSVQLESITAEQTMSMTLDIPGDQYPGLPTISIQELDELVGIQPEIGSDVTGQTQFRWQPSIHPDTIIGLNIFAVVGGRGTIVDCSLVDDGEYSLPDAFQSILGDSSTTNWSMSRSRYVDHIENGAYLEVARTVSTDSE